MSDTTDVLVVGGGAAGLAAALILGRSRRSVVVVDAGEPRNAPAAGVHNLLGQEGTSPGDLVRIGREEVAQYGVRVTSGRIVAASATPVTDGDPVGFTVTLDSGATVSARRVVVASGAVDVLPDVPGLAEQWGRGVVHCPFCHGWEVRDRRIGVLVTTPFGAHQAHMWRALSEHVTVFPDGPGRLSEADLAGFRARGIAVETEPVASVDSVDGVLRGVTLADGSSVALDAVTAASTAEARVAGLEDIGLVAVDQVMNDFRIGSAVPVGPTAATDVPGVWAAGNVASPMASVAVSAAAGTTAGAAVHGDLIQADLAAAMSLADAR